MHTFDHLSVFIAIIIALGVTHLISSITRYIHLRDRIKGYPPVLLWALSLLVLQVQIWWSSFYRREITQWSFFGFSLYLLIPILVSMLCYLALPELEAGTDMEREYHHNRKWFFGLLCITVMISLLEDFVRQRTLPSDANLWFRIGFGGLALAGYFISAKRFHFPLAIAFLLTLVAYIGAVFSHL